MSRWASVLNRARADDYSTWSDEELQDHHDACLRVAAEQRIHNHHDKHTSTEYERACRRTASRYADEIARREKGTER